MSLILDLTFALIAVITVIVYTARGLVKTVVRFGNLLVSVLLAAILGPYAAYYILIWFVEEPINNVVTNSLGKLIDFAGGAGNASSEQLFGKLPEWLSNFIRSTGVDGKITEIVNEAVADFDAASKTLSTEVAEFIASALGCILVFFVVFLFMKFVILPLLNLLFKLPVLKPINHFLGFVIGVGFAFVYVFLAAFICVVVGRFSSPQISEAIRNSFVINFMIGPSIF